jgi:hypothetical protein
MDVLSVTLSLVVASASVVAALLSLWLESRSSKPSKELSVEILSDISLPFTKEQQNEIEASVPLKRQMRVISVRVQNTGRVDILSSDYIEPIRLAFNEPVLSSSLTEEKGAVSSAPWEPKIDLDVVVLPAIRLHPKGFFTINTLLSEGKSNITVEGFIAGGQIVMANLDAQHILGSWRRSESPN